MVRTLCSQRLAEEKTSTLFYLSDDMFKSYHIYEQRNIIFVALTTNVENVIFIKLTIQIRNLIKKILQVLP